MAKIFITGCAGFVGSNVVKRLIELGHEVSGCDDLSFGYRQNLPEDFIFDQDDISNIEDFQIEGFDALVSCHTANIIFAQTHPIATHHTNTLDTINLFRQFDGKIIYTSTSSVYGNAEQLPTKEDTPIKLTNAYARSKYCAELFLQDRGDYTTLRLTNVYGTNQRPDHPYSGVMGKVLNTMLHGGEISVYGDGQQTRDFVYVDDVVDAIVKAIDLPAQNTEINIGTGIETSVNQLIKIAEQYQNEEYKIRNVTPRAIDTVDRRCLDNSKALELLGWSPKTDIHSGIAKTVDWLLSL
jgi:UDP-glucose 4-epimerase